MRVLPNMTVVYPGCEIDVRAAVRQAINLKGPCYLGLSRAPAGMHTPYSQEQFQIGRAIQMTDGCDAALFTYGAMLPAAVQAAEILKNDGMALRVYNMHTIKPLDTEAVSRAARDCGAVFTLEEENVIGGLGGAVAEYLAEHWELRCPFKRLGVPDTYGVGTGSQRWLQKQYGLDAPGVAETIRGFVK